MSNLRNWFCPNCQSQFTAYCPICAYCAEVAYELESKPILEDEEVISIDEYLEEIENSQDNNDNTKGDE